MDARFGSLSFVFPAWNEEEMIERTVAAAVEAGEGLIEHGSVASFEVIVVDDGSTDRTPVLLDALAARDRRIVAVHHEANCTLGAALRTGFAHAQGELVLYTDADLPFDLSELAKAVRLLHTYDADLVSLYRLDRVGEGPRRFLYSYVYNLLVRSLLGLRVRDVNFAGKLLRRGVLEAIELRSEGSFIDAELLARAQRRGFHIIQFGVDYFPRSRGTSTLSSPAVIARILAELWAMRAELRSIEPLPAEAIAAIRSTHGSMLATNQSASAGSTNGDGTGPPVGRHGAQDSRG